MMILVEQARTVWRSRTLVWGLTRREVASRHSGTVLGVLWPYLQPLLTIAAYYLVFDVVFSMRLGDGAPARAVGAFLIVGALPWMAFCDAVSRGMSSLLDAGGLLQKNPLPPVFFVARTVLASLVVYMPLLLFVAIIYVPSHQFRPAVLAFLPLLVVQTALSLLLGFVLAILAAALRDTVQVIGFFLSVGIYLSPVLFPLTMFPEEWRWVLWMNPMTSLVQGYQEVLLRGDWPPMSVWLVSAAWLSLFAYALSVLLHRSKDQLVDWL